MFTHDLVEDGDEEVKEGRELEEVESRTREEAMHEEAPERYLLEARTTRKRHQEGEHGSRAEEEACSLEGKEQVECENTETPSEQESQSEDVLDVTEALQGEDREQRLSETESITLITKTSAMRLYTAEKKAEDSLLAKSTQSTTRK